MNHKLNPALEALLFAAGDEGLSLDQIATALEISNYEAEGMITDFKKYYEAEERGIHIVEFAGVFQFATKKTYANYLQRLVEQPVRKGLSKAALETLAIIAYKQPITRMEIEEIRGVRAEHSLHILINRILIEEVGRSEGMGRPILYGTTNEFLDYFGLKSLNELPELPEVNEEALEDLDLYHTKYQEVVGSEQMDFAIDDQAATENNERIVDFSEVDDVLKNMKIPKVNLAEFQDNSELADETENRDFLTKETEK